MTQGWIDRVQFLPASGGLGNFVVASAVTGYNTPAQSNAVDGVSYHYVAQIADATGTITAWEVGTGVYTVSTTTLARTSVEFSSNANAKVNFATVPTVTIDALAADFPGSLTLVPDGALQEFYVATTGSDSNDGSTGAPWLTIQHAVDVVCSTYCLGAGALIKIHVAAGTYSENVYLGVVAGAGLEGGSVQIAGASVSTCFIASPNGDAAVACIGGTWSLINFTVSAPSLNIPDAGAILVQGGNSYLGLGTINYGNSGGAHNAALFGGYLYTTGTSHVNGSGTQFIVSRHPGSIVYYHHGQVIYSVNPGYTETIECERLATVVYDVDSADSGTTATNPQLLVSAQGHVIAVLSEINGTSTGTISADSILTDGAAATITAPSFMGDAGSGGLIGYVPAPASGDAAAGKFLKADASWAVPPSGGTGANPTATGSNVVVNGSATTFLRSDGAFAIQLTTSGQFGLCKVDNSTITASGGVITAVGASASLIMDVFCTLDPAFLATHMVLSGGNLTATDADAYPPGSITRSTISEATGKFYCEMVHTTSTGGDYSGIGFCNSSQSANSRLASGNNGLCYYDQDGGVYFNGSNHLTLSTYTAGDIIDMAVDIAGQLVWFRKNNGNWNNNGAANPTTGANGLSFAGLNAGPYFVAMEINSGQRFTINFGTTPFTYAAPSGYGLFFTPGSAITGGTANYLLQVDEFGTNLTQIVGSDITVGATSIKSGTAQCVVYENASHFFSEAANFTISASTGNANITAGTQLEYNGSQIIQAQISAQNFFEGGAGNLTNSSTNNLATGPQALLSVTTSSNNLAIGIQALKNLQGGSGGNVAVGTNAMNTATSASTNFAFGASCMFALTTGSGNVGIGPNALAAATQDGGNVAIGSNTLLTINNGSGAGTNLAIGNDAMHAVLSGSDNTAIGPSALYSAGAATLFGNIAIGGNASKNLQTGSNNLVIGYQAASGFTSGSDNTVLAYNEATLTTGSNNVVIGNAAGLASGTASNQLVIQNIIYGTGNSGTGSTPSTGMIGIGLVAPTATLHLFASTTAKANLRFDPTSAAGPTSPNDGDMWYDGTHLNFRIGGTSHVIV